MDKIIYEISNNIKNDKKLTQQEVMELIQQICQNYLTQFNAKKFECLIKEDQEYTYQQIYDLLLPYFINHLLQFNNENELCMINQFKLITQNFEDQDDIQKLMLNRLKQGFLFSNDECRFANPDIFQYIRLCCEEIKQQQQQQQQQAFKVNKHSIKSQQEIIQQKQSQKENQISILEGLQQKNINNNQFDEWDHWHYKYYNNESIQQIINKCGWKSGEKYPFKIDNICEMCVKDNQIERAAAIACVHFDFKKAQNILEKSEQTKERQYILMALQGVIEASKITIKEIQIKILEIPSAFLKNIIFQNPYLELISEFLRRETFLNYLNEKSQKISFFDRTCLFSRFLKGQKCSPQNKIEQIIYEGRCNESIEYLQQFVDESQDIQLGGVVACHFLLLDFPKKNELIHIFSGYIDYLQRNNIQLSKLFCRIKQYDKEENPIKSNFNHQEIIQHLIGPQISMICSFCLAALGQPYLELQKKTNPRRGNQQRDDNPRTHICVNCSHALSNCVVCAQYFTVPQIPDNSQKRSSNQQKPYDVLNIDQAMVWCLNCKHGGHQKHLQEWFELYDKCPACECECLALD